MNPGQILGATPVFVKLDYIKFNFESGHANDAVLLQYAHEDTVHAPEWNYMTTNKPIAYVRGASNLKIRVAFDINCPVVDLTIKLIEESGNSIGEITSYTYTNYADMQEIELSLTGSIADYVSKQWFRWKWEVTAVPASAYQSTYDTSNMNLYSDVSYYVLYATPVSPMLAPWKEVLDLACTWAFGKKNELNIVSEIAEDAYQQWDVYYMVSSHSSETKCNLTNMFNDGWVDCQDMSAVVQIFSNALGVASTQFLEINAFRTQPYLAINETDWNKYTIYWPINHQVGYYNGRVFDACYKVNQNNPRIPINELVNGAYKDDLLYPGGAWTVKTPSRFTEVE